MSKEEAVPAAAAGEEAAPVVQADDVELLDAEDAALPVSKIVVREELTSLEIIQGKLGELDSIYREYKPDVSTTAGLKNARAHLRALVTLRTSTGKARLAADKEDRARIAARKETADLIETHIREYEDPLYAVISAEEERKAAEKAEKERIAQEKAAAIVARIQGISSTPLGLMDANSTALEAAMNELTALEFDPEEFGDLAGAAWQARDKAVDTIRDMLAKRVVAEAEEERRKQEAADRARADAEAARVSKIADKIRAIEAMPLVCVKMTASSEIQGVWDEIDAIVIDDSFAEFAQAATAAQQAALDQVNVLITAAMAREVEERRRQQEEAGRAFRSRVQDALETLEMIPLSLSKSGSDAIRSMLASLPEKYDADEYGEFLDKAHETLAFVKERLAEMIPEAEQREADAEELRKYREQKAAEQRAEDEKAAQAEADRKKLEAAGQQTLSLDSSEPVAACTDTQESAPEENPADSTESYVEVAIQTARSDPDARELVGVITAHYGCEIECALKWLIAADFSFLLADLTDSDLMGR